MNKDQGEKLPHLKELAIILNNIPVLLLSDILVSVVLFVQKEVVNYLLYFLKFIYLNNLNGWYKDNMKSDLIEQRCLLKTNINILEEMSERLIVKD